MDVLALHAKGGGFHGARIRIVNIITYLYYNDDEDGDEIERRMYGKGLPNISVRVCVKGGDR